MVSVVKKMVASLCLGGVMTMVSPLLATSASAAELQRCASEGGICRLPYPAEVVYGTGGRNTSRFIDRPEVPCSNRVFNDPAPGKKKSCSFVVRDRYDRPGRPDLPDRYDRDRDWRPCAKEGGYCDFYGRKRVRYGAKGRFIERTFRDGVDCDNYSFGDPAPGKGKACYVLD